MANPGVAYGKGEAWGYVAEAEIGVAWVGPVRGGIVGVRLSIVNGRRIGRIGGDFRCHLGFRVVDRHVGRRCVALIGLLAQD